MMDFERSVDKLEFIILYENVNCGNSSSSINIGRFLAPVEVSGLFVKAVLKLCIRSVKSGA